MARLSPSRTPAIPRPAAGVWPGLFDVPRAPVPAAVARRVTRAAVSSLPISLTFPDGTAWGTGGPRLQVVHPEAFFRRLGTRGLIGFGEAWMTGDLTSGDWHPTGPGAYTDRSADRINAATDELTAAVTVLARRVSVLVPQTLQKLHRAWLGWFPHTADNTPTTARENVHRHYDLSNELFELFLDPTMTYSAAWFEPGDDLPTAQVRKIDGILDLARVSPGMRILEIGSGWGALAIRAAIERGARVTTLTLSPEQKALAERRIAEAGVSDRIAVVLQDYRDHAAVAGGAYDAVVSVEMIEAVGERYWPAYFTAVDRMLADGGRFAVQAITMPHERLRATRNGHTWVQEYVFPGGMLPSTTAIRDVTRAHTDLRVEQARRLGPSYVPTLRHWRHRFNRRLPEVRALGFDETFIRMWNFYLAYSEAGFAADYLDVWQIGLAR